VRLITRAGNDFSGRFPFIAMAVGKLPVRSCLIDGEAIVCDENGLAVFELIRRHGAIASAVHCAFDLLELDGKDLRRQPIEERPRTARSYSARLAGLAVRALCLSALARLTASGAQHIG
jgi:bifunctional non-homologous end joining protein LigD